MKLASVLTTVLLLAAPAAAAAQGHGGFGHAGFGAHGGPGMAHGVGHGGSFHRPGFDGHRGFRHDRFLAWGWPYWGWSNCGPDGGSCDWSGDGATDSSGYADASMTAAPSCGAWVRRGGRYAWASDACDAQPAADPPQAALASNECSDWVWRGRLHHSVCRRPSRLAG